SEFKHYFKEQLSAQYTDTECAELYSIFIQKIAGLDRFQQNRQSEQSLSEKEKESLEDAILKLKIGQPFQQILGETEFYGFLFFVNEHVLIPRPETEELLEFAINEIKNSTFQNQDFKILDIGTGSGIIPIVLKKHFPKAKISAIDISENALNVAKKNAEFHHMEINFIKKDFLSENLAESFDIIISNPPYIGKDEEVEIADSVKHFEPNIALFSPTSDTLIFYRKIADFAEKSLTENGMIFLEINQKLGEETLALFQKFKEKKLLKDLSGNDRIVFVRMG
ncbi:MAG: peptide chain release factor N(5)-glutamine methyltransferase, partial [Cruoricaptor ignavus]|nr:peptide chain release factor N(5)-glutamine methyltransferase [Cruoricaptor ignavus]